MHKSLMNLFQFLSVLTFTAMATSAMTNPIEVGQVRWTRDYDNAQLESQRSGKPILILFQEVPGCAGCKAFGREVLSNALLVEAIESEFVPLLVYNNRSGGRDEALLKKFNEPAWNYQVVRFVDGQGHDLIQRRPGVWDVTGIANRMILALEASNRSVPKYLATIALESDIANLQQSAFAMHCFWAGEARLGQLEGVVSTEAGWIKGREVVKVTYHPKRIHFKELKEAAEQLQCADLSFPTVENYHKATASDQNKQIENWDAIHRVPNLTAMQLTKINAFAADEGVAALEWLSPRQREALRKL